MSLFIMILYKNASTEITSFKAWSVFWQVWSSRFEEPEKYQKNLRIPTVQSERVQELYKLSWSGYFVRAWTNDKCLATKHHQTLFGDQAC